MKRLGSILWCLIFSINTYSQNLVINGDFEETNSCHINSLGDWTYSLFPSVKGWNNPTLGTSNYFNSCMDAFLNASVPTNSFTNYTPAHSGSGYVSLLAVYYNSIDGVPVDSLFPANGFHNYIQGKLSQPLEKNKWYCLSFWVWYDNVHNSPPCTSPGLICPYDNLISLQNLGLKLSKNKFSSLTDTFINTIPDLVSNVCLNNDSQWVEIRGAFRANGGEEWLTIGNFKPYTQSVICPFGSYDSIGFHENYCGYFIDDVSVSEISFNHASKDTFLCALNDSSLILSAELGGSYYLWNTGDTSQQISVSETGIYWYITNFGCGLVRDTIRVIAHQPPTLLPSDFDTFCKEGSITLNGHEGFSNYSWNTGDTTSSITIYIPGMYILTASTECGFQSDTVTVFGVDSSSQIPFIDTLVCFGTDSPSLIIPGINILWYYDFTDTIGTNFQPHISTSDLGETILYVTQNETGCESSKQQIRVRIIDRPEIDLPNEVFLCFNDQTPLTIYDTSRADSIYWNSGETSFTIYPHHEGIYLATVVNHCGLDTGQSNVHITACTNCFFLPTAFSPNDDGVNDVFNIGILCPIRSFRLNVYNRWGNLIFSSNNFKKGWDGSSNGIKSEIGAYYFDVKIDLPNGTEQSTKGEVTLIR